MSYANSAEIREPRPTAGHPKTLVVGLGNPILGDDGVGWRVAQVLQQLAPEVEVECLSVGGLSLMERLIGYDCAVIVDAIHTGSREPGSVLVFPLSALPDASAGHTTSVHDTSLKAALDLGRKMGARLPAEVYVVAIEAVAVFDFTKELTPAVAAAIPRAVEAVLEQLKVSCETGKE
jgi:hydrogenase maturation protease